MVIHEPNPLEPVGGKETPEKIVMNRRKWLAAAGVSTIALGIGGRLAYNRFQGTDVEVVSSGESKSPSGSDWRNVFPARRDDRFTYGRAETDPAEAARYTNFYEFSRFKWCWRYVDSFNPEPWTITVGGLCNKPFKMNMDELHHAYAQAYCERQYRHRCVEKWAMAVPWSGIPLAKLLQDAVPKSEATHVRFVSFNRPSEAPHQASDPSFPWPYTEGLTLREAMNELTFVSTGMYGKPLLKQHGAPIRLVVPWKYGFKSIKSIERIEFVSQEPATFWTTLNPMAYPFESNVDPAVPRPWPQDTETMLGTNEHIPTEIYNGYGDYVRTLYS